MKVKFAIATNREGSKVIQVFDVAELLGCSDAEIEMMLSDEALENTLHYEWQSWTMGVIDGGFEVYDE